MRALRDLRFSGDVDAVPEGTIVFADEPLVRVTAPLIEAQIVETRLMNLLHFQTVRSQLHPEKRHRGQPAHFLGGLLSFRSVGVVPGQDRGTRSCWPEY